jgi:hypothetical protein
MKDRQVLPVALEIRAAASDKNCISWVLVRKGFQELTIWP